MINIFYCSSDKLKLRVVVKQAINYNEQKFSVKIFENHKINDPYFHLILNPWVLGGMIFKALYLEYNMNGIKRMFDVLGKFFMNTIIDLDI